MFKGIPNNTLFVLRVRPLLKIDRGHFFGMMLASLILFSLLRASPRVDSNLSIDEPYTANLVNQPLSAMWTEFQQVGYEITYHLALKSWALLFGDSAIALRSLSLLFYSLAIPTIGLAARHVGGVRVGLCAAYLMAVSSPLGMTHAANARPYALLTLQVSLALLACFRIVQSPPGARHQTTLTIVLICLHVLGLMNHPIYLFFLVGCLLASPFVSRRGLILTASCCAVALAIYLLLWWPALQTSLTLPRTTWMHPPVFADLIRSLRNLWGIPGLLLLAICVAGAVLLRGKWVVALAVGLITMIGALVLISQVKPVFNPERTPMLVLPAVSVLVALLIARLKSQFVVGVVLALVGLNSLLSLTQDFFLVDSFPTSQSVGHVLDRARCGDTLVLGALSFAAVEYELRHLDVPDCIRRESFPLSTESHPGWMDLPGLLADHLTLQREASETADRLETGATVWLFYIRAPGDYQNVTDILKWELDRRFDSVETMELRGLYFDSILVYSNEVTEP